MFRIAFLIILFNLGNGVIYAQQDINRIYADRDYREFRKTLADETDTDAGDSSRTFQVQHPATLPGWFYSLPVSENGVFYSLGISDPGMESEPAFRMAYLRAGFVAAYLIESRIKSLADNYSIEKDAEDHSEFLTKYANFFRITAAMAFDTNNFRIKESYFSPFGEAIVLAEFIPDSIDRKDSVLAETELYQVDRQKHSTFEMEEKYELSGLLKNSSIPHSSFRYSACSRNNLFEINSVLDSVTITFPYINFRYIGNDEDSTAETGNQGSRLTWGLWKAFMEAFFQDICLLSQNNPVNVSRVGDDFSEITQDLTREVGTANPAFRISGIQVKNNQMSVGLEKVK